MKPSQLLTLAAQKCERAYKNSGEFTYACDMIEKVCEEHDLPEANWHLAFKFFSQVKPSDDERHGELYGIWAKLTGFNGYHMGWWHQENMNDRIVGICLAAAIAKAEGQ